MSLSWRTYSDLTEHLDKAERLCSVADISYLAAAVKELIKTQRTLLELIGYRDD